mmetsp:Transcript_6644/g.27879  ORF Transcript_6644/g.27879 Transcript_6644/m.27879 type:complete len:200 (+) Transcript_6644:15-614(+)
MPTTTITIEYCDYGGEAADLDAMMRLVGADLSEPYSIFTYRYFLRTWPRLCVLAKAVGSTDSKLVGVAVSKTDDIDAPADAPPLEEEEHDGEDALAGPRRRPHTVRRDAASAPDSHIVVRDACARLCRTGRATSPCSRSTRRTGAPGSARGWCGARWSACAPRAATRSCSRPKLRTPSRSPCTRRSSDSCAPSASSSTT